VLTARAVREQMDVVVSACCFCNRTNKPTGFDCPRVAWPDKEHTSTFQFCENGAKAVIGKQPEESDAGVLCQNPSGVGPAGMVRL